METKITKIETYIVRDKLSQSFYFSQWRYSERCICLVKITDNNGNYGWGEGYGPATVLEAGIKLLKPLLIGENPLNNEVIWSKMYRKTLDYARKGVLVASISAIDIAIMDLKGKTLGLPVSSLIGGAQRKKVEPYATGMYFSDLKNPSKNYQKEAEKYINMGFKAIKMKVGLGVKQDFHNVKLMREIIGNDIMLMIDSNHAYNYNEALSLAKKVEQFDISWFEEPLSPEYYEQYAELRKNTIIPIAGGECEYLRFGFLQLLKSKSLDILQPDICSCGGITEAKRIAALATSYGIPIVPHTWGSGIGIHVALQFIANLESIPGRLIEAPFLLEYDQTENRIRDYLTIPKIKIKNGEIQIPTNPGLGVDVDERFLYDFSESDEIDIKKVLG
jgi:D-galactarolactone cycloisomerase